MTCTSSVSMCCAMQGRERGESTEAAGRSKCSGDWYIERAIAGLGAIGYRGYAACELVLEKVTGYRFATLRAICDARRARAHKRDEDTEETLNRELEELLGYRRQVARDITDAVLLFPGRRDSIGQEAKDVLPSLRARIRKIEKALKAIRERRDT